MESSIINTMRVNRLSLIIAIIVPLVMILISTYFDDIPTSLYVMALFGVLTGLSIYVILNPFWGMVLMIIYMPYSGFITIPIIESVQRLIFILVAIGWFLKYVHREKSVIFDIIKSNKIIILFILSMVLSSFLAVKPLPSFKMSFQIATYIFMAFIMQDMISDKKRLNILITVIAVNIGVVSLFGISDYLVMGTINEQGGLVRIGSVYGSANQFGKVLVFGIPFLVFLAFNARSFLYRSLFFLLLLSSIFSLGLSLSRSYMLAFVVFVVAYIGLSLKNKTLSIKKVAIILIIIFVISFLIYNLLIENIMLRASKDVTQEERYIMLQKGIDLFKENPLFGIGWKNFSYVDTSDHQYGILLRGRDGHEIISSVFVSIGMVGSLTLIALFYMILKWLNKAANYHSLHNDKYLLNFIILLQSGYIASLSTAIGTGLIFGIEFWLNYALSVLLYRWRLRDMAHTASTSINKFS